MSNSNAKTWTWSVEQEPPQAFQEALSLCDFSFVIELHSGPMTGYAQSIIATGNITRLLMPMFDFSERSSGITLKNRWVQHPAYFIVNAPVLYWPYQAKETPP